MLFVKNERLGLLVATVLFGVIGLAQFWRAFAGIPVSFGEQIVPLWVSFIVGTAAVLMACWLGMILNRHRPLV